MMVTSNFGQNVKILVSQKLASEANSREKLHGSPRQPSDNLSYTVGMYVSWLEGHTHTNICSLHRNKYITVAKVKI